MFLVIDNFGDLYEKDIAIGDRVIAIARQGLSYGVHVMTSAIGWLVGQKQALLNVSNARIQLRLSNPDESQMGTGIEHRAGGAQHVWTGRDSGSPEHGHEMLIGVPEIVGPTGERVAHAAGGRADRRGHRRRQGGDGWPACPSGLPLQRGHRRVRAHRRRRPTR